MKSVLEETTAETGSEARRGRAGCGQDVHELGKRIERAVDDAKGAVSAKLADGKFTAEHLLKRGRYAAEDGLEEAVHTIKRNPLGAVAIAFAAGAAWGFLVPRLTKRPAQGRLGPAKS